MQAKDFEFDSKILYEAIVYLAGICDGAARLDGQGFNGADSGFGHSLANQINDKGYLTARQQETAYGMLRKYRKQLEQANIALFQLKPIRHLEVVPDPDQPKEKTNEWWVNSEFREGLSHNQQQGFDLAHEWFFNSDRSIPFVLRGFAGVGKTFLCQRIVKSFQSKQRMKIALAAPTHKARSVLERFAHTANLSETHITTLHSLLHLRPGTFTNNGKQKLVQESRSTAPYYSDFHLVVVDESSMIGDELYKHIPYEQVPTIFMGDPAQLPPVENDEDSLGAESPIFKLPVGIELTEVMRYEGAIADYVTNLRKDITQQFVGRFRTKGNITKCDRYDFEMEMHEHFTSKEFTQNSDYCRALAWTNKRVSELNQIIRNMVNGGSADETYYQEERLMAKDAIFSYEDGREQIVMYSCQECIVDEVRFGSTRLSIPSIFFTGNLFDEPIDLPKSLDIDLYELDVVTDLGDLLTLYTVHESSRLQVTKVLSNWKKAIQNIPDKQPKSSHWALYYEALKQLNLTQKGNEYLDRLQYAYALTIHQSQGSTINHAFVDVSNVMGQRDPKYRNQLLYVACSRASEHLYAYTKF